MVDRKPISRSLGRLATLVLLSCAAVAAQDLDTETLWRIGAGNLVMKKYPEADVAFRQILQQEPCHARAIKGLAEVYFAQNRPGDAVRIVQAQAAKCTDNWQCDEVLGDTLIRADRDDEAAAAYQRSLARVDADSSEAGELHLRIADVYRRKKDRGPWGEELRLAAARLKGSAALFASTGLYQDTIGQKQAAMDSYREALRIEPNHPAALNNLAYLLAETGADLDRALELARRARALLPDSAETADTIGFIYTRKKWTDVAILTLKSAVEKEPDNELFRTHLAEALDLKPEPSQAVRDLKAALRAEPTPETRSKIQSLLLQIAK
jgi:tetratricopeptide (TPR) repeat protein